jgi:hypothetical protein
MCFVYFVGYFTTLALFRLCAVNSRMTYGLLVGRNLYGTNHGLIEVLSWNLPEHSHGNLGQDSWCPNEILTECFPNASLDR